MRTLSRLTRVLGVCGGGWSRGSSALARQTEPVSTRLSPQEGCRLPQFAITIAQNARDGDDVSACDRECTAGQADSRRRLGAPTSRQELYAQRTRRSGRRLHRVALGDAPGCVSSGQMHEYGLACRRSLERGDAHAHAWSASLGELGDSALENGRKVEKDSPRRRRRCTESARKAGRSASASDEAVLARDGGGSADARAGAGLHGGAGDAGRARTALPVAILKFAIRLRKRSTARRSTPPGGESSPHGQGAAFDAALRRLIQDRAARRTRRTAGKRLAGDDRP